MHHLIGIREYDDPSTLRFDDVTQISQTLSDCNRPLPTKERDVVLEENEGEGEGPRCPNAKSRAHFAESPSCSSVANGSQRGSERQHETMTVASSLSSMRGWLVPPLQCAPGHRTARPAIRHLKLTSEKAKEIRVIEVMLSWNVMISPKACCVYHCYVDQCIKSLKRLKDRHCSPGFSPGSECGQCPSCGILDDDINHGTGNWQCSVCGERPNPLKAFIPHRDLSGVTKFSL